MSLRDRVFACIREVSPEHGARIGPDQSLIKSGLINSLMLFTLVVWVEREIGSPINLAQVDLPAELDTVNSIVAFIERERRKG